MCHHDQVLLHRIQIRLIMRDNLISQHIQLMLRLNRISIQQASKIPLHQSLCYLAHKISLQMRCQQTNKLLILRLYFILIELRIHMHIRTLFIVVQKRLLILLLFVCRTQQSPIFEHTLHSNRFLIILDRRFILKTTLNIAEHIQLVVEFIITAVRLQRPFHLMPSIHIHTLVTFLALIHVILLVVAMLIVVSLGMQPQWICAVCAIGIRKLSDCMLAQFRQLLGFPLIVSAF
mmetsp:Transcript_66278/g.105444  ORF Transcript_66278/g.105444 Transcript_66278/m.105444 type:complete len:233 (+) Transcript_66278:54-752(+)